MYAGGRTYTYDLLWIREYMANSSMGSRKLTQVNCFKLQFQNIRYTFDSLGLDEG